jgi:hypothetical protein
LDLIVATNGTLYTEIYWIDNISTRGE